MSDYKIDKGIPLPRKVSKYPLADMQIGDSFFVANLRSSNLWPVLSPVAKRIGIKITTRKVVENGVEGIRIWRIA